MIFDKTIKMADVVLQNPFLIRITERFGMALGFKEKTIEEVCQENNINVDVFFLVVGLHQDADEEFSFELTNDDMVQLLAYLKNSHKYYNQEALPEIVDQIKKLTADNQDLSLKMVEQFFDQYVAEVNMHLSYEEKNVFPYALSLIKNQELNIKYSINEYKQNHNDIETKLDDLKNLLIRHLPDNTGGQFRRKILLKLFNFEEDLNIHTIIEERFLIPYVSKIERQSQNKEA